ncbi:hypothetical protein SISNIDRAFT_485354 [Sistotremastrum niveocremeum HHB9708]|uniref:Fungal-type protein kinase domain-containing protein n=1 Tax=Sistotremastrum niveocremeum HHB9708 TaxID=1314777 RepID=A0A164V236_9AGAM|nr:hypothetical protein SISNIDRAFT_485354 [Sistotremastrum niveocremeum HHB9708]
MPDNWSDSDSSHSGRPTFDPRVRVIQHELSHRIASSAVFLSYLCERVELDPGTLERVVSDHWDQNRCRWRDWIEEYATAPQPLFNRLVSSCGLGDGPSFAGHGSRVVESMEVSQTAATKPFIPVCRSFLDLVVFVKQTLSSRIAFKCIYGVFISASNMTYVRFDRAGAIISDTASVDTTVSYEEETETFLGPSIAGERIRFIAEGYLHRNAAIQGSAARVLIVRKGEDSAQSFVLKDWWRSEADIDEGEVARIASGRFGLPEYVSHWAVCESDGALQDTDFLEDSLVPGSNDIMCSDDTPDDDGEFRDDPPRLERPNRVHSRLVTTERGEHLLKFRRSPIIILAAIHDAILGHWGLFKAGYLHCDVSYGNLLVLTSPMPASHYQNYREMPVVPLNDRCTAILNDFDTAKPVSDVFADAQKDFDLGREPRGTTVYMSAKLLLERKRTGSLVHDDLESFLWILIAVATWVDPPDPSSEAWRLSFERKIRYFLFPMDRPLDRSDLAVHKLGLFTWLSKYSSVWPRFDPKTEKYLDVIKKWSEYTDDALNKKLMVSEDVYYLDILNLLRNASRL